MARGESEFKPVLFTGAPTANANCTPSLAVGRNHACALLADKSVVCWGINKSGQLGDGKPSGSFSPLPVKGLWTRPSRIFAATDYMQGFPRPRIMSQASPGYRP